MKLTVLQLHWFHLAGDRGYEAGFWKQPFPALRALERNGLIERDPQTRGRHTHWRITAKGQALHRLMS